MSVSQRLSSHIRHNKHWLPRFHLHLQPPPTAQIAHPLPHEFLSPLLPPTSCCTAFSLASCLDPSGATPSEKEVSLAKPRGGSVWLPVGTEQLADYRNRVVAFACSSVGLRQPATLGGRHMSTSADGSETEERPREPRESMEYDAVIVGAGPAGLAAAIRLKQVAAEKGTDVSVCVVEKGAEVGAHILSGNVFETRALDELLPDWREREAPIRVPVTQDRFLYLTEKRYLRMPSPFSNHNNYVISLSEVVRWLGRQAEELGVEIYPGFAASEVLYSEGGERVVGIATNDMGIAKDGTLKASFQRGMELRGGVTLLAEGCRGFLSEEVIGRFKLRQKAQHQTYALGIKEVWEVEEGRHRPGEVVHTVGYPLSHETYGGSFIYHIDKGLVALGLVVALDYKNPFLSPYEEFNRWKQHPAIRPLLEGGSVVQYGARALNEGGFQSIPELAFPGGALIGCSAGFLNVPKIKGTHTAMKSGMLAAEAAYVSLTSGEEGGDMASYGAAMRQSWVWEELRRARNIRPGFHWGLWPGIANAGLEHYITRGRSPWTLRHGKPDHEALKPAAECQPIQYPKPDGQITFDILTSLYRSSTNHDHDQPSHLRLRNPAVPSTVNLPLYAGPETKYCPARVYEYVADDKGTARLQINAQNCLHCKACSIKDPTQNIDWTVPEGGGGPGYSVM